MSKSNKGLAVLPYIMVFFFAGLSIWLSIQMKQAYGVLREKDQIYTAQLNKQTSGHEYRIFAMQQVLEFNFMPLPKILPENDELFPGGKMGKIVLYLKRDGCSDCNIGVV